MERGNEASSWLLVPLVVIIAAFLWQKESGNQLRIQQLESELTKCQIEFKGFRDGVTYGKGR